MPATGCGTSRPTARESSGDRSRVDARDGVGEVVGLVTPTIGEVTTGWVEQPGERDLGRDTPRRARRRRRRRRPPGPRRGRATSELVGLRPGGLGRPSRGSAVPARGPQGITSEALVGAEREHLAPPPRADQVVRSCIETKGVQPFTSATCWAFASRHAHIEDAPRGGALPARTTSWERLHRLPDRHRRVPAVDLVEVDVVGAETAQRPRRSRAGSPCATGGRRRRDPAASGRGPWWR